jgi:hypothetical protein
MINLAFEVICFNINHPHTRGEYEPALLRGEKLYGSPPHAWGIPKKASECSIQSAFCCSNMSHKKTNVWVLGVLSLQQLLNLLALK